jgi:general secretion pathway protein E
MRSQSALPLDVRTEITVEQVRAARQLATESGRTVMQVLEEKLGLGPAEFVSNLGVATHYPILTMADLHALTHDFGTISYVEAARRECIAFRDENGKLLLVFADPFNHALLEWANAIIAEDYKPHLGHWADIGAYLARHEENMRAMDNFAPESEQVHVSASNIEDLSLLSISEDGSPVVKLVHSTLYDGLKSNASDIHLEAHASGLAIKYRIDGVLITAGAAQGVDVAEQVLSRIKVMAELDIAERRIPQDGRFKVAVRGREIDFRVSIMPSLFGEDAVLRILDRSSISQQTQSVRLDVLGFDDETLTGFRRLTAEPYGMVLVTGPTGSGKTTTLYGAITEINSGHDKIITIEDPVEYQLHGVLQIPVNEKKGLTFARGLRSILRHDPDKIMVGEIRDPETAQIAVQSALTGHLVLTTVHANNVFDVLGRFMHMGVDPYSFVSALNGILAQRLVRVICPHCAVDAMPDADLLKASGLQPTSVQNFHFKEGRGCGHCRGTGFKGRKAIGELLTLNDEIRELIVNRAPLRSIKDAARRAGTRYLRESALRLVENGDTTIQEINRVTTTA